MQTRFAFTQAAPPRMGTVRAATRRTRAAPVAGTGTPRSPHDALLVLDVETVPDAALVPADWPADRFPKNAWHRIVAVSFVTADILHGPDGREGYVMTACRSGGGPDWDEGRLLGAFWRFFETGRYRVVTWNGRAFDMPTILARSMIHGVDASAWFCRGSKWEGYRHRFAIDWHTDLMDAMSEHGAAHRMTLAEAAATIGLPGKLGEHGSNVAALVEAGELDRVRGYCETDCLNTFVLYLRWAHLTGRSDAASHDHAILSLTGHLASARAERPHLGRFLDAWREAAHRGMTLQAPRTSGTPDR
ncbi:3'-5' exonuclease [Methylobacterium oryzae]|uniref:3'-5' exonuclease n=1 Tax=Methylobacterium oryzae TaxID=334852 RepID=A0ABU7TTR9_9HYPH